MYSFVGIDKAREPYGIPTPSDDEPEHTLLRNAVDGGDNLRVRVGRIRARWHRFDGDPFDWPIFFVTGFIPPPQSVMLSREDEARQEDVRRKRETAYRNLRPLLGLGDVVTDCRWTVVGPRTQARDDGYMIFEDTRAVSEKPGAAGG